MAHAAPAAAPAGAAGGAAIDISGVSKRYLAMDGEVEALRELTLQVRPGEFVSVLGPSGCGKSTLMLLVAGLEKASGGTITIGGQRIERPFTDVGIVFQDHALLDWRSVLGNVMLQIEMRKLPPQRYLAHAGELLERVGLAEFAQKYPFELSGGMRQRAAIVRALVHDPPVLFMDEPFGALDALTREQMRIDLEKLWLDRRQTVLFITHSIQEAVLLSDRVVVMTPRPGQIDRIVPIGLPRPRDQAVTRSPEFVALCEEITARFMARGVIKY